MLWEVFKEVRIIFLRGETVRELFGFYVASNIFLCLRFWSIVVFLGSSLRMFSTDSLVFYALPSAATLAS